MKVAVISVTGAFRSGKTFLLSLMLRYLSHSGPGNLLIPADGNDDLLQYGNPNVHGYADGFRWRGGVESVTVGIWMSETPFIRKSSTEEDIAVFLLDTQGTFDLQTTPALNAVIFRLAALLSSRMIYNVKNQIQADHLQHLTKFASCGRMAAHTANDRPHQAEEEDNSQFQFLFTPFQRLDLLVRDWENFSGRLSLVQKRQAIWDYTTEKLMGLKCHEDVKRSRRFICSSFEKVNCFLLPHPGRQVASPDFDGSLTAVDADFLDLATLYFDEVFGPSQLQPKSFLGDPATCGDLLRYAKRYIEVFKETASCFPSSEAIAAAMEDVGSEKLKQEALQKYKEEMEGFKDPVHEPISDSKMRSRHSESKKKALDLFDEGAILRDRRQVNKTREEFVKGIASEYFRFKAAYEEHNTKIKTMKAVATALLAVWGLLLCSEAHLHLLHDGPFGFNNSHAQV